MTQTTDIQQLGLIGVLMGGFSSERDISLKSGKAVFAALREAGCRVTAIDIVSSDTEEIAYQLKDSGIEAAFIALHGQFGEDGGVQSLLEKFHIPYTGSGAEASRLAMNKISSYEAFEKAGLIPPAHRVLRKGEAFEPDDVLAKIGCPLIVKPSSEGSSIGITIVQRPEEFPAAVQTAFGFGPEILVETYVSGREMTVGILGEEPLPVLEIRSRNVFFDFAAKYQQGMTDYLVPAPLSPDVSQKLQQMALRAHRALGCEHFSRVDFMLDADMRPWILEINTIPGFTATSLLPKAAKAAGIEFPQLCLKIIRMAYETTKK
jgi:D-alanine-D-alanine ligase